MARGLAKLRMLVEETGHDVLSTLQPMETVAVPAMFTLLSDRPYGGDDLPFYIVELDRAPFYIEEGKRYPGLVRIPFQHK